MCDVVWLHYSRSRKNVGVCDMGINDRDYMRRSRSDSSGRTPQRQGASLWSRFRFGLWLIVRRLSGRRE